MTRIGILAAVLVLIVACGNGGLTERAEEISVQAYARLINTACNDYIKNGVFEFTDKVNAELGRQGSLNRKQPPICGEAK